MPFKKGDKCYWSGKKRPKEWIEKYKEKFIKNLGTGMLGKHLSEEHKRRISVGNSISNKGKTREKSSAWKGGRIIRSSGYIYIHNPNHPFCGKQNYIAEHRLIMEKHIGRYLSLKERVHHINGIKTDNRIENLLLVADIAHHRMLHRKQWDCDIKGCNNIHYGKGLCEKHYHKLRT